MFSGYGQSQAMTGRVFYAIEKYLEDRYQIDRAFDMIETWDEADAHRLVSAFLGKFPHDHNFVYCSRFLVFVLTN